MEQTKRGQKQTALLLTGRFSASNVALGDRKTRNGPGPISAIRNTLFPKLSYAGTHVVADFWFGKTIEKEAELEKLLHEAAAAANSKPLKTSIFKFAPQGITGVILLAESHIAVHTWPEIGYIAVDIFTCGKESRPKAALGVFKNYIQPQKLDIKEMKRGKQ